MSTPATERLEEGSPCPDEDCGGTLEFVAHENCLCHIRPPCDSCTYNGLKCDKCGERPGDA